MVDQVDHGMVDGGRAARLYRLYRLGADHGLGAAVGYDDATGLGTPTATYLVSYRPVVTPVPVAVVPSRTAPVPPSRPAPADPDGSRPKR
ncbi:MAG: hypothetical protein ACJ786_42455 [Catenulispora sp.]